MRVQGVGRGSAVAGAVSKVDEGIPAAGQAQRGFGVTAALGPWCGSFRVAVGVGVSVDVQMPGCVSNGGSEYVLIGM